VIVSPVDPSDADDVADLVAVTNAVRACDSPWEHLMTAREAVGELRHGWEGRPAARFLGRVDGVPVATGSYETSAYDNRHLVWVGVLVRPDHRRRGHGSALFTTLRDRARAEGRTSIGIGGWDATTTVAFATAQGLDRRAVEVNRRQWLGELDRAALAAAYDGARPHAAGYELVRVLGRSDDADLPALAAMTAAINDAPTDDLDIEDSVFAPERIRAYEDAQAARGHLLHRVVAREIATGALAGHSVVAVDGERPSLAEQHDTSVVAAHRGHRLGLLLKLEMLRWLAETQPQVATIDTWNAESNDRMIGVNELLGYRVVGRELAFQGRV